MLPRRQAPRGPLVVVRRGERHVHGVDVGVAHQIRVRLQHARDRVLARECYRPGLVARRDGGHDHFRVGAGWGDERDWPFGGLMMVLVGLGREKEDGWGGSGWGSLRYFCCAQDADS